MSGVLPRIIITAEEAQDELKDLCYIIKVISQPWVIVGAQP